MTSTITWVAIGVSVILMALLLLSGGSTEAPATAVAPSAPEGTIALQQAATPQAPVVDVGPDIVAGEREAVALDASGYDPAGGRVVYRWTAEGGLGFFNNANVPDPIFTAPSACDCDETVLLTLTVTNERGLSASDSLILRVRNPIDCPQTCTEEPAVARVDPCQSADASCPQPNTACSGPCIEVIPASGGCGQVPVPCRCETDCGPTWDAAWPGEPEPGHPRDRPKPRIHRRFPEELPEGGSTKLRAMIANPGCTSLCFSWSASKGWFEDADTLEPVYHAPMSDRIGGEPVTISLVVYDGYGGRSYDQIRMDIDNLDD